MVWHIFKKDWKLLWSFVLMAGLLQWISVFVFYKRGLFNEDATLEMLARYLPTLAFFASMFLIAAIVHLEALPGIREDWLTRPISRSVLLLEKFILIVVTVEGPIFAANLAQGLANGFSLKSSFFDALLYSLFLLFFLFLPIFAFASVTKNMTEAFIFGCGCTFIIAAFLTLSGYLNEVSHQTLISVTHSGIGWIGEVLRFAILTLAASAILGLQYFRRKTTLARILVISFGVLLLISTYLPWKPAFAIEKRLSPRPGAGGALNITFDPTRERFKPLSGLGASEQNGRRNGAESDAKVFLPLRITGMGSEAILLADRVEVHVFDSEGRVVYHGIGEEFEVPREGPEPKEEPLYQQISIPMPIYEKVHDQDLTVRMDYSLTLFGLDGSFSLPALNGDERTPAWGWCQTKMNEAGTAVQLHCMKPGRGPTCGTVFLENLTSGARNPSRSSCLSEYAPFNDRPVPDVMARFGTSLSFRDPTGLAKYPVDGSQLPQSRVVIRTYLPEDHFVRTLMIPRTKLRAWESQ